VSSHRTKCLRLPARLCTEEDRFAEVDVRMVRLVRACWALGFDTAFCCEGDPGSEAYVLFVNANAAAGFAAVAGPSSWSGPRRAEWTISTFGNGRVAVYFPRTDIGRIALAIEQHISKLANALKSGRT
jgi:hypothetical protein